MTPLQCPRCSAWVLKPNPESVVRRQTSLMKSSAELVLVHLGETRKIKLKLWSALPFPESWRKHFPIDPAACSSKPASYEGRRAAILIVQAGNGACFFSGCLLIFCFQHFCLYFAFCFSLVAFCLLLLLSACNFLPVASRFLLCAVPFFLASYFWLSAFCFLFLAACDLLSAHYSLLQLPGSC